VNDRTSVVVVDEFPMFCEAIGAALALEEDIDYLGYAVSTDEAVELVVRSDPDVALIDVDLPNQAGSHYEGINTVRRIKEMRPKTRVLILAGHMDIDTMARAAAEGACGFLPKTSDFASVRVAIRTARDGGMFVEQELVPPMVDRLRSTFRRPMEGGSPRADVTPRELEVLTLLGQGLDATSIARRLGIKMNTSRGHIKNLLQKLESHSQLEAVVEAVHQGLLPHLSR
jgi:DNA-binding NarL/FixJ family response regulator